MRRRIWLRITECARLPLVLSIWLCLFWWRRSTTEMAWGGEMTAYERVARDLRAAILRGDYAPGETIPRSVDLAERYGLSRWTIRQAIALLEREGLVSTVPRRRTGVTIRQAIALLEREGLVTPVRRRGTVVRDRRAVRIPWSVYSSATAPNTRGPWERACAAQGIDGRAELVGIEHQGAPTDVATALGVAPGAPV